MSGAMPAPFFATASVVPAAGTAISFPPPSSTLRAPSVARRERPAPRRGGCSRERGGAGAAPLYAMSVTPVWMYANLSPRPATARAAAVSSLPRTTRSTAPPSRTTRAGAGAHRPARGRSCKGPWSLQGSRSGPRPGPRGAGQGSAAAQVSRETWPAGRTPQRLRRALRACGCMPGPRSPYRRRSTPRRPFGP